MSDESSVDVDSVLEDAHDKQRKLWELEQFHTVIQHFPGPVFLTDSSGYVTFANQAFVEQLGYSAPEADLHVSDFLVDEDVDAILDALREMVSADDESVETQPVDLASVTADGRRLEFNGSVTLLSDTSQFAGVAVSLRNVTAKRRRDEVFDVINRTLRHNLRNTVTVINSASGVLEGEIAEEHEVVVDNVYQSAQELQTMGERLRTLQSAILESFEREDSLPVERIVESSVRAARTEADQAEISTHLSARGTLAAHRPVEYALTNIVENAIVHSDQDTPTVEVWVTHAPQDGWVDIHVEDDGPGIPAFERDIVLGEIDSDQLIHGSGMGLWIVRWVVEVLGGDIVFEENEPRGTVVTLRLPLEETVTSPG